MSNPLVLSNIKLPQSATRLFIESIGKVNFAADGGIAIIAGIIIAEKLPQSTGPLWGIVSVGILLAGILLALVIALLRSSEQTRNAWTEIERQRKEFELELKKLAELKPTRIVKSVVPSYLPYPPCSCILIVSWSSTAALAVNTGVSISIAKDTHEQPLGFGTVRHIQEDGYAVVTLDAPHNPAGKDVANLLNLNTPELLSKLRVGVQVSLQHLETTRSPVTPNTASEAIGLEGKC